MLNLLFYFLLKMAAAEEQRFGPQITGKIKCSQFSCDQPPHPLETITLGLGKFG